MPEPTNITLPFSKSYAFIIGINEYENGISKLKTAVKDAEDIAELLGGIHKYEVIPSYNAGKKDMLELFAQMKQKVKSGDRVFFYFAGHGIAFDSETDPEGFLVPADANTKEKESLVPMKMLRETLHALPCKHGLIVLDCCFSGAFKWSTGFRSLIFDLPETLYSERFFRFVEHPAWQVITSSAHDQKAIDLLSNHSLGMRGNQHTNAEEDGNFNSPFAFALKEAINQKGLADVVRGKRSDGVITATELYLYLRDIVENAASEQEMNQSPAIFTLSKHDTKGEYIFLHPNHQLNLPPAPDRNPYKGLDAYSDLDEDIQVFFGRNSAVKEIADKIEKTSLLVVSAPSGTGKTSTIKAGVFPYLKQNKEYVQLYYLRPGEGKELEWEKITQLELEKKQVIFIDQYEEMFSVDREEGDEEINVFEAYLVELFKRIITHQKEGKTSHLKILLAIRSDFEWQLQVSALGKHFWNDKDPRKFLYRLPPMTTEELKEAMVKPAWRIAYEFESEELINRILEEINYSPGALPLLSFTLNKLYEFRDRDRRIFTQYAYEDELGGINGVLSKHADKVFDALPSHKHKDFMRKLMLRMLRLNDGSYTRRRIYLQTSILYGGVLEELDYPDKDDTIVAEVLEHLIEKQLLRKDKDDFGEYIEPIHDSLINFWPKCLQWILEMGRENLVLQRQLWEAVVEHHRWQPDIYSQPGEEAPLWDNNPKLQQVQLVITDPKDVWFCQKGWGEKSISSMAYLLWVDEPSQALLKDMHAYHWFFEEDESKKYYPEYADPPKIFQQIKDQMNNWLNEAELDFVKRSFKKQRSEIERLKRERDDARATAMAAKARQIYSSDNTIGLNMAYAAYKSFVNEETIASMAYVLNAPNSQHYKRLDGHRGRVEMVAFSPDGKYFISASLDGRLIVWSAETQQQIKTFKSHEGGALCVAFSPDGREIISGGADDLLVLREVETGKEKKRFKGHTQNVESVAFSPDGKLIASGSRDETLRLWSVESAEQIMLFDGKIKAMDLAFSPDGSQIITGGYFREARLWSVASGKEIKQFAGHTRFTMAVAFSSDGKHILTGSADQTIRWWNVRSGKELKRFEGHIGEIKSLAFTSDGSHFISASTDQTLRLWSMASGKEIKRFNGHNRYVVSTAISSDGKSMISGSYDRTVRFWPLKSNKSLKKLEGHLKKVRSVAISHDSLYIASASDDKTVRLWSVESGEELKKLEEDKRQVLSVAFSPDNKKLLSSSADGVLNLWSIPSGKPLQSFEGHTKSVYSCAFSPDGKHIYSTSADKTIRQWNIETAQKVKQFTGHRKYVRHVRLSSDGKYLLSSSADKTVRLWSTENGEELWQFEGAFGAAIDFSPDGKHCIIGTSEFTIKIWEIETKITIKEFEGHTHHIRSLACSPDGKLIVSGSDDHSIRLWSVESEEEIYRFETHSKAVYSVAFSADGTQIVSSSADGAVQLRDILMKEWDLDIHKLDEAERKKYKVEVDY